jgi:hypothetical protein
MGWIIPLNSHRKATGFRAAAILSTRMTLLILAKHMAEPRPT